jgi:hypothetical protein
MSIGLPVVATQAALSGYFPRKATGAGGWEPVPVRTFCGRNLTQDDVFFVGASPDEYTAALIDAYSNEKVRRFCRTVSPLNLGHQSTGDFVARPQQPKRCSFWNIFFPPKLTEC